ncbi:bifunctional GNAT family N-acetyltransferase/acetate--CoA ligase family protein [Streptomyces tsukubensis]|uniref:Acyl-CoA synthetase n=1 Tax=Streptomyces tsukubensis (strain DSM 42081 / NBRC 108919 / NRRL 18488 / 9993) TaxID=1114943 RepID=A0A7G3UAT6_STRT9|nr:bifunctional GNAT family N-acetyltransferase/acetate--CoA ligase family protein [Streptomyces tsukubensis]AZK96928.1 acyl-CoA synthetase [Streptomyces tsukubensis]QKM67088.1 acyl-CoA synthetase [Streptomyces tsukubensis NRRL18488]TAI41431.1 GNAT family N-acetyltransferase [Streptomyces tsukubensis]
MQTERGAERDESRDNGPGAGPGAGTAGPEPGAAGPGRPAAAEHAYPDHWEADVVLRDGATARIRPITAADGDRLVSFYEQVSDESKYYRFFAPYPHLSAKDVHRFTHHDFVDRVGLAVTVGGEFIATVRYDRIDRTGRPASAPADGAEVAFLVQDAHQGRGIASTMLEHIAAVARERGIRRFAAEVLPANNKMIKVFRDAGYTQRRSFEDGTVHLTLDLEPTAESVAVQRAREHRAEARSVQRLLAPRGVAVVGVGRAPGGLGRTVLRDLIAAGYTGRTYAVNRAFPADRREIDGVPAYRSVREITGREGAESGSPVDLAVVAVPAERVPDVVTDCGEAGVRGLVVLSAGYAESGAAGRARQRELVRRARSYGMRIIGPNSFGVINNAEAVRLNASLAPYAPAPGRIGLFTQSGAIGIALLAALHRRGAGLPGGAAPAGPTGAAGPAGPAGPAGLSTFVSSGNRADVSGNDILQYWYEDPDTDVALLYLESIGNPRKFTRLARRTAAVKPVVVVKGARHSGSEPPGHAVPVARIPDAAVDALLRQAGVIRVDTVTELVDVGLLLAGQPLPGGPRVAILGNSESLGLLTYDACLAEGLRPLPPLDLTTGATPAHFRAALVRALAADDCDAVVVTAIPWVRESGTDESGDGEELAGALRAAATAAPGKPVVVVQVELGGLTGALASGGGPAAGGRGAGTFAPPGYDGSPAPSAGAGASGGTRAPGDRSGRPGQQPETGPVPGYPDPEADGTGAAPEAVDRAGAPGGAPVTAGGAGAGTPEAGLSGTSTGTSAAGAGPGGTDGAGTGAVGAADGTKAVPGADESTGPGRPAVAAADGGAGGAGEAAGGMAAVSGGGAGGAVGAGGSGRAAGKPETTGAPEGRAGAPTGSGRGDGRSGSGAGVSAGANPAGGGSGASASAGASPVDGEAGGPASVPGEEAGVRGIPAYPAAERAVRALAEAVKYGQWRREAATGGKVPEYEDIDEAGAAELVGGLLAGETDARGITLAPGDAHALLAAYGIRVEPALPAPGPDEAVRAAERLGYPVALKTTAPHLRHRADLGGVRLDLGGEAQLRRAYRELTELLGKPVELQPVVQAMAPRGVDTVVRAVVDPAVGPYLSFGLAGVASELLGDTAHRLIPVTDRDAAGQIRSIRTAPLLFGWRGSAPVDTAALEHLLLRVSRLVDDHPEVVGVGLEPVVVSPAGLSVLGASVRLASTPVPTDLGPRRLPSY